MSEAVQVPYLDGLVSRGRRQVAHVWAQQALEDVLPCAHSATTIENSISDSNPSIHVSQVVA